MILRKEPYAPRCTHRDETSTQATPQVVALRRGVTLEGVILDRTGVPVEGLRLGAGTTTYEVPPQAKRWAWSGSATAP